MLTNNNNNNKKQEYEDYINFRKNVVFLNKQCVNKFIQEQTNENTKAEPEGYYQHISLNNKKVPNYSQNIVNQLTINNNINEGNFINKTVNKGKIKGKPLINTGRKVKNKTFDNG